MEEDTTTSKSPSTTAGTTSDSSWLISEKPITLTYWVLLHPNAAKLIQNHNESVVYQQLEKLTGIKIDFMHPPLGQQNEQFQLIISSNNLPDIIEGSPQDYPGGPDLAIQNGTYVKLNDLIDEYAPNYKRLMEQYPRIAKDTITDQGNIYCFQQVQEEEGKPWVGPFLRGDWLDDLGLEVPETIDDWYIMLKAFKDSKGASVPLALAKSGFAYLDAGLNSAWGVGQGFYRIDNIVKYGPAEPMYKDFLMTMNKWYTEGLIDKDFATRDRDTYNALFITGKSGAFIEPYGTLDTILDQMKNDPKVKIVPAKTPVLKHGDEIHFKASDLQVKGRHTSITTACKHVVEAVKWFDTHYSEEGRLLFNYGIEGQGYEMVNGKPVHTELMLNNPDNLSYFTLAWKYKLHVGPFLRDGSAEMQAMPQEIYDATDLWNEAVGDYEMPPVSLTPDEGKEFSNIMSEIKTYVEQMNLKFIMGQESFDNYDVFTKQLSQMKIDDAIKLQQAALDRYNKR